MKTLEVEALEAAVKYAMPMKTLEVASVNVPTEAHEERGHRDA